MILEKIMQKLALLFGKGEKQENLEKPLYNEEKTVETQELIMTLWDLFEIQDNTQVFHLINVISFDEWVDMEEIRRRIKELFSIEYKNEKSLYAYIKTMVDLGLIETTNAGGRRKWRKKELLLKTKIKKIKKKEEEREIVIEE